MICSTRKVKFIHIRIPKCASTSLSMHLRKYCDPEFKKMYKTDRNGQLVFPHMRYYEYKNMLEERGLDINDYFIFSFIRDPYDLMISRWRSRNITMKFNKWLIRKHKKFQIKDRDSVMEQQIRFLTEDGEVDSPIMADYFPKYEDFDTGLRRIGKKLKIDFKKLPVTNKSNFSVFRYPEYSQRGLEIINERFADDFRRLGYDTR